MKIIDVIRILLLTLIEEHIYLFIKVYGAPPPLSTDQQIVEIVDWEPGEPMVKNLLVQPINMAKPEYISSTSKPEIKKKPLSPPYKRKIEGKKSFMQYLMEKSVIYLQTSTTPQPVIYNTDTNSTYTSESIHQMCKEAYEVASNFGISDVSSFAVSNCRLIRLYYPTYTCEQITDFLEYCKNSKST